MILSGTGRQFVNTLDWHARYLQQAGWTAKLRAYVFENIGAALARRILEVGCGTGAVLSGIKSGSTLHGLDIDHDRLQYCRSILPKVSLVHGDALTLPYREHAFEIVYCHYFLLWVKDPITALKEMKRVTSPGGFILALAEPDHYARIDKPAELAELGEWQSRSLERQGADPGFGRLLAQAFVEAGIQIIETGIIQRTDSDLSKDPEELRLEWLVLESDLKGMLTYGRILDMKNKEEHARARGERYFNIPTYFAWGKASN